MTMDQEHAVQAVTTGPASPGDALRALPAEAADRGTRFISAQAMQARLFSVYDAAAAAEDALALVQDQLTLTLNRSYYEADEIEQMAQQLDALLALDTVERAPEELVSDE
ncbi:MAG TPA: hypothetical protein VII96_06535 [Acidimicrobiales bacterium]